MTQEAAAHFLSNAGSWLWDVAKLALPSAAIVFVFFKWAGKTTIGHLLNRDLETFKRQQQEKLDQLKAEQQKELELLRHLLLSRVSRIHEKEFEVLPKAWLMLNALRGAVWSALDMAMKPIPDFYSFPDAKLEAFLASEEWLTDYQKNQLRNIDNANEKQKFYMDACRSRDVDLAVRKHQVFNNYLIKHRIFMTDDLRTKFSAAERTLFLALTKYQLSETRHGELANKARQEMFNPELEKLVIDIEKAVQLRLRYEDAA